MNISLAKQWQKLASPHYSGTIFFLVSQSDTPSSLGFYWVRSMHHVLSYYWCCHIKSYKYVKPADWENYKLFWFESWDGNIDFNSRRECQVVINALGSFPSKLWLLTSWEYYINLESSKNRLFWSLHIFWGNFYLFNVLVTW